MNTSWRIALSMFAASVIAPLLVRALSRTSSLRRSDPFELAQLASEYRSLELWSQLIAIFGMLASGAWALTHAGNTPWSLGIILGWAVLAPVVLVAICTLPRGIARWHGVWRFYELRYGISLRLVGPVYTVLCLLGVISTAVVLSRQ